jgi:hypothetical protein
MSSENSELFNIPCGTLDDGNVSFTYGGVLVRNLFTAEYGDCRGNAVITETVNVFFLDGAVSIWREDRGNETLASRVRCCHWEEKNAITGAWEPVMQEIPCWELGLTTLRDPNDPEKGEIPNSVYIDLGLVRNPKTVWCDTGLVERVEQ